MFIFKFFGKETKTFKQQGKRSFVGTLLGGAAFSGKSMLSGLGLVMGGVAFLTLNERREVQQEKLRLKAQAMTVPITDESNLDELDEKLIHYCGLLNTPQPPEDHEFHLTNAKIVTLRRKSEMYQWRENEHVKHTTDKDGKSTTTTTYTYDKVWSASHLEVQHSPGQRNPAFPPALAGQRVFQADLYKIGDNITLSAPIQNQLTEYRPLYLTSDLFPPGSKHPYNMALFDGTLTNVKNTSRFFGSPEVGDVRVFYDAIYSEPYTTVSVLKKDEKRHIVVPLVGRLKAKLSSAGPIKMPKDSEQILGMKLDSFIIPEPIISQMENILMSLAPLTIGYIESGSRTVDAAFQSIKKKNSDLTDSLRFVGGAIIWAGCWSLTGPFALTSGGAIGSLIAACLLSYQTIQEAQPKGNVTAVDVDE